MRYASYYICCCNYLRVPYTVEKPNCRIISLYTFCPKKYFFFRISFILFWGEINKLSRPIANYWRVFPLSKYFVYSYEKKIMLTQFMKLLIQKDIFFNPDYFRIDMWHIGKGFLWKRNWWNIYFDNWVNHSYLAKYVCLLNELAQNYYKTQLRYFFFCNFPLFFPSASKTLKTVLPQSNRKSFSKKNKLFLHFSSLLQLLLLEPYHHYHPNVPNLNYYAKKQKKKQIF